MSAAQPAGVGPKPPVEIVSTGTSWVFAVPPGFKWTQKAETLGLKVATAFSRFFDFGSTQADYFIVKQDGKDYVYRVRDAIYLVEANNGPLPAQPADAVHKIETLYNVVKDLTDTGQGQNAKALSQEVHNLAERLTFPLQLFESQQQKFIKLRNDLMKLASLDSKTLDACRKDLEEYSLLLMESPELFQEKQVMDFKDNANKTAKATPIVASSAPVVESAEDELNRQLEIGLKAHEDFRDTAVKTEQIGTGRARSAVVLGQAYEINAKERDVKSAVDKGTAAQVSSGIVGTLDIVAKLQSKLENYVPQRLQEFRAKIIELMNNAKESPENSAENLYAAFLKLKEHLDYIESVPLHLTPQNKDREVYENKMLFREIIKQVKALELPEKLKKIFDDSPDKDGENQFAQSYAKLMNFFMIKAVMLRWVDGDLSDNAWQTCQRLDQRRLLLAGMGLNSAAAVNATNPLIEKYEAHKNDLHAPGVNYK